MKIIKNKFPERAILNNTNNVNVNNAKDVLSSLLSKLGLQDLHQNNMTGVYAGVYLFFLLRQF